MFAGLKIPRWPLTDQQRVLAVDADRADFADLAARDDFAQGAEGGVIAGVELQADEEMAFGGEPLNGGLLVERGAERFVAENMPACLQRGDGERAAPRVVVADGDDIALDLTQHRRKIDMRDHDAQTRARRGILLATRDDFGVPAFIHSGE